MGLTTETFETVEVRLCVAPQTISGNPVIDVDGTAVDLALVSSAAFYVYAGVQGDTLSGILYWDCYLVECDTTGGSYTKVADADVYAPTLATNAFAHLNASAECSKVYGIAYKGSKSFVKIRITGTGVHTVGTIMCGFAVLGLQTVNPVTAVVLGA